MSENGCVESLVSRLKSSCVYAFLACSRFLGKVTDEPLATMAEFRAMDPQKSENRYFAQNAIPALGSVGQTIRIGDSMQVLQWGNPIYTD